MPFRFTVVLTLCALLGLSAFPQKSNVRADHDPTAIESLKNFERELCDLLVRGEWDAYARHLADDYVRISTGKIQGKEDVLNDFRTSKVKIISMVPEQMDVRVYGNAAVMLIQLRFRERTPDGKITEKRGRPIKLFVRRGNKWYLAELIGSPVN
jgi:ketosteroid isomerase-like protein